MFFTGFYASAVHGAQDLTNSSFFDPVAKIHVAAPDSSYASSRDDPCAVVENFHSKRFRLYHPFGKHQTSIQDGELIMASVKQHKYYFIPYLCGHCISTLHHRFYHFFLLG